MLVIKRLSFILIIVAALTLSACAAKNSTTVTTTATTAAAPSNQDLVNQAEAALIITDSKAEELNNITANLNLPTTGMNNTSIIWFSSNPDVISNSGVVTQPAYGSDTAAVKLYAIVSLNGVNSVKIFNIDVPAMATAVFSGTVAKINAQYEGKTLSSAPLVEVKGMVAATVGKSGFYLSDGTGIIFVYGNYSVTTGEQIDVTGSWSIYSNQPQLSSITINSTSITGYTMPTPSVTSLSSLNATSNNSYNQYITITGTVGTVTVGSNTDYTITDSDNNVLTIYYNSPADAITALKNDLGDKVTISIFTYSHNSSGWTGVFEDNTGDLTVN